MSDIERRSELPARVSPFAYLTKDGRKAIEEENRHRSGQDLNLVVTNDAEKAIERLQAARPKSEAARQLREEAIERAATMPGVAVADYWRRTSR
jgi:hypothetical protein